VDVLPIFGRNSSFQIGHSLTAIFRLS